MADKADAALKLAHQINRDLKSLKKDFDSYKKTQAKWEADQIKYVQRVEKSLIDYAHKIDKLRAKNDAAVTTQIKALQKQMTGLKSWVEKNFDKKGFF